MSSSDNDYDVFPQVSEISQRVIISAIISLTFVIAIVLALHLYARIILSYQAAQQRRTFDIQVTRFFGSENAPTRGLNPKDIASLPIFKFKQLDGCGQGKAIECAVCLSALKEGELARSLSNCKHIFHAECIDKWLRSVPTCPMCRTEARPRPMPEPREPPAGVSNVDPDSSLGMEEGTSDGGFQSFGGKISGSSFGLSSFTRMLSRDR